eukprot:5282696-Pyramimonas_sp.AAC.1
MPSSHTPPTPLSSLGERMHSLPLPVLLPQSFLPSRLWELGAAQERRKRRESKRTTLSSGVQPWRLEPPRTRKHETTILRPTPPHSRAATAPSAPGKPCSKNPSEPKT